MARCYEYGWRIALQWSAAADHPPIRTLTKANLLSLYEALAEPDPDSGKIAMARARNTMAALRRILSYAVDKDWLSTNPATKLQIGKVKGRKVIWEDHHVAALETKAREAGLPSIALAVHLAAETGQRRANVLALRWGDYDSSAVTLRQQKTGKLVRIPATADLKKILQRLPPGATDDPILRCEQTGKAWNGSSFGHRFRDIADDGELITLWFMDLRRTAVVRLARAGCTVPEIAAITGHDIDDCARILDDHYLPTDAGVAANAIAKLDAHRKQRAKATPTTRGAVEVTVAATVEAISPSWANPLKGLEKMARPERLERPTLRFAVRCRRTTSPPVGATPFRRARYCRGSG